MDFHQDAAEAARFGDIFLAVSAVYVLWMDGGTGGKAAHATNLHAPLSQYSVTKMYLGSREGGRELFELRCFLVSGNWAIGGLRFARFPRTKVQWQE